MNHQKLINTSLLLALSTVAFSCKKDSSFDTMPPIGTPEFRFLEDTTIIYVDNTVKEFQLKGVFTNTIDSDYNRIPIMLDTTKTTARHKIHFINNVSGNADQTDGINLSQTYKLIPENIKDERQLVFYVKSFRPYDGNLDTTVIKLIPKEILP